MVIDTEVILALCGVVGSGSLINFFVQRHFSRKDERSREEIKRQQREQEERDRDRKSREDKRDGELRGLNEQVKLGLETIKLLSYARVAEEADRLISKGYATSPERSYMHNLHTNYKAWGWNGDMDERMAHVLSLPSHPISEEVQNA